MVGLWSPGTSLQHLRNRKRWWWECEYTRILFAGRKCGWQKPSCFSLWSQLQRCWSLISNELALSKSIKMSGWRNTYLWLWSALNWIGSITVTGHSAAMSLSIIDLQLEFLSFSWWFDKGSFENEWCTCNSFSCISKSWCWLINNNLKSLKMTSIVNFDEKNVCLSSCALCPSSNSNDLADKVLVVLINSCDSYTSSIWHGSHWFLWDKIVSAKFSCIWLNFSWGSTRRGAWVLWCGTWGWPVRETLLINKESTFCSVHFSLIF